jgi:protein tyrosine phosphatase
MHLPHLLSLTLQRFDYNRVMLSNNGYVNASHISCSLDGYVNASSVSCSLDGSALKAEDATRYIASQGPLPETFEAFWRLVFEQGCPAIVMLTNLTERGSVKCSEYYPRETGEFLQFPSVSVRTVEAHSSPGREITLRKIEVRSGSSQQEAPLVVTHFHYHHWPDHGVPEESMSIRSIIKAISKQRERLTPSEARPTVIHCSAGIGRTGAFISIDMMLQRLQRLAGSNDAVDSKEIMRVLSLPDLVHDLRRQRMGSVQSLEQYCFIYQALYEELSVLCEVK